MPASSKYKQLVFLLGTSATGKTTISEEMKYLYRADVIHADQFYDWVGIVYGRIDYPQLTLVEEWGNYPDMNDWRRKWYEFQLARFRNTPNRTLVVEGATPKHKMERDLIMELVDVPVMSLLLEPDDWEIQYSKKHNSRAERKYLIEYGADIEFPHVKITNLGELREPMMYQRVGFTDEKWRRLQIGDLSGKSVLDLGCSTGWFNMYATGQNVARYVGVDNQWKQILKARSDHFGEYVLGDIGEYLNNNREKFDIVIMASTLHYFENKREVIKKISQRVLDHFILEIPIHKLVEGEKIYKEYPVEGQSYFIPTEALVLRWLGEYFATVEVVGESVPPDNSYRLIFKAYK